MSALNLRNVSVKFDFFRNQVLLFDVDGGIKIYSSGWKTVRIHKDIVAGYEQVD